MMSETPETANTPSSARGAPGEQRLRGVARLLPLSSWTIRGVTPIVPALADFLDDVLDASVEELT